MYPWFSSHWIVKGISPLSHVIYNYAPPDFYFYDVACLRCGAYIGDYGGELNAFSIGPVRSFFYRTPGALVAWAYGADVEKNPAEDTYVNDEKFGNYPGTGIFWTLMELYDWDKGQLSLGNDTALGFGIEVRRFLLHQIDLAQPYIRWVDTPLNNSFLSQGEYTFTWQVNGSLVVDHTYLQWGTDSDVIHKFNYTTSDYNEYAGDFIGGTGWDKAADGETHGITYSERITFTEPGEYYLIAKAQVDQIYRNTIAPFIYGKNHSYLRVIKERTNEHYYEEVDGSDGIEIIKGTLWWYSPVLHITIE
jgi:hypothetical protein